MKKTKIGRLIEDQMGLRHQDIEWNEDLSAAPEGHYLEVQLKDGSVLPAFSDRDGNFYRTDRFVKYDNQVAAWRAFNGA